MHLPLSFIFGPPTNPLSPYLVNQTAMAAPEDLFFTEIPRSDDYSTGDAGCGYEVTWYNHPDSGILDSLKKACQDTRQNIPPFEFFPQVLLNSTCFAASNPSTETTPRSKYAPTGIYCSSLDFRSLYDIQSESTNDNARPCCHKNVESRKQIYEGTAKIFECTEYCPNEKFFYTTRLKDTLTTSFGLRPSTGVNGSANSACGWINALTQDENVGNPKFYYNSPEAFCVLTDGGAQFKYPWFLEQVERQSQAPVPGTGVGSVGEKMFRLPVVDLDKATCTPSPFLFAGHADDPSRPRSKQSIASFPMPCKLGGGGRACMKSNRPMVNLS